MGGWDNRAIAGVAFVGMLGVYFLLDLPILFLARLGTGTDGVPRLGISAIAWAFGTLLTCICGVRICSIPTDEYVWVLKLWKRAKSWACCRMCFRLKGSPRGSEDP